MLEIIFSLLRIKASFKLLGELGSLASLGSSRIDTQKNTKIDMSYSEKFRASDDKSRYQLIATKILRDLGVFRSTAEKSPTTPRRWIWELIQNAKDVYQGDGVDIDIDFRPLDFNAVMTFKHNGKPFTADNIRYLIEQISTKDREVDENCRREETGKFGTGFLSTHLLSEFVDIDAIAKEPEEDYRAFQLHLDRSGRSLPDITKAVQIAKESVQGMDGFPIYDNYNPIALNTTFTYPLNDPLSHKIARKGLDDIDRCLKYSLLQVARINKIKVISDDIEYSFTSIEELSEEVMVGTTAKTKISTGKPEYFTVAFTGVNFTTIYVPISVAGDKTYILPIDEQVPRLFCDFPLIGTESFPFPVIINNPNVFPTDPRDGIFLYSSKDRPDIDAEENRKILLEARSCYFELLDHAIKNKWEDLHQLADMPYMQGSPDWYDADWVRKEIIEPIRSKLLYANIIKSALNDELIPIQRETYKYAWFPHSSKQEIRKKIWKLANEWIANHLPREGDVELWYKLSWPECGRLTTSQFADFVEQNKTLAELKLKVPNQDVYIWLNDFYKLLQMEDSFEVIISKKAIYPNQNGDFFKKGQLHYDKGDIGEKLKEILKLLGNDIKIKLFDEKLEMEAEPERIWDKKHVIKEIIAEVANKTNDRETAQGYREAFTKLLSYFRQYPKLAEEQFTHLFRNKHLLYNDEEIQENIQKAEELDEILQEFKVTNLEDLREILSKRTDQQDPILPITQEILSSLGISNIEEWKVAIQDKDLAALFDHNSVPTEDMFVFSQMHIQNALNAVIAYLATLGNYDLTEMEQTAPTVLAGIKKNSRQIFVVVRPAYKNEVVIYYRAEQDVLDYEDCELWADTGSIQKLITLGHIIKTANIKKFPI